MNTEEELDPTPPATERRVSYVASLHFAPLLHEMRASLLVSTYQAGKLAVIGTDGSQTAAPAESDRPRLEVTFHNFELAMGVAVHPHEIAVGTRQQIYFLQNASDFARRIPPAGKYDQCFLTRRSHFTGNIHGHEMAYAGDELWVVNTLFSCLCTLDDEYHFVPRWRPPFVSEHYDPEDRCHLNGLALEDGRPKFVTVMAESDTPQGWRPNKSHSGCVVDVDTGATVTRGLAMPHSPRIVQGRLLVLDSGRGELVAVDRVNGKRETITNFPGYARGFGVLGPFAFIGLSKIRETAVFGGVPIAENRDALKCGVAVVDLRLGRTVATFEFTEGVEEIFAVEVLPNAQCVALRGPHLTEDGTNPVWVIPPPSAVPPLRATSRRSAAPSVDNSFRPSANWRDLMRQGIHWHEQGRAATAVKLFEQAAELEPGSAELLNHWGNALQDVGQQDRALAVYRRAVAADPKYVPAHQNLGYLLMNHGEPDAAVDHYATANKVTPAPMNRVLIATALPVVYDSRGDLKERRERLEANVRQMTTDGVQIDTTRTLVPTTFFLAYQGYNDRDLLKDLASVYHGPNLAEGRERRPRDKKIKVGFLSAYFRDHTIGRLNLGRIQRLNRDQFDVAVIAANQASGKFADAFRTAADQYVVVPRQAATARQVIADLGLDVLVFADVGMDALASTLVHSRMAPVQCATWGHPSTTGSPHVDYFASIAAGELPEADAHYTERLVRMPSLGIYYDRPQVSREKDLRAKFGLNERQHVFACPQTLFKFHPEFDEILGSILRADKSGELVLLEGRVPNWTRRLQERFSRTIPDVMDRIRFLPAQPQPQFLQLLATADVVLDPLHFGGGNTTLEALAVGTPVVTLPSPYLRSRLSAAMYHHMGATELIAKNPKDYVLKAVRLALDNEFNRSCRNAIAETCGKLFSDDAAVRDWEAFLERAVEERGSRG